MLAAKPPKLKFLLNGALNLGAGAVFSMFSDGTIDGAVAIGAFGELSGNGIIELADETSIEGDGLLRIGSGGNLKVKGSSSVENLSLESYGTISGAGTLAVTDAMTWSGGTMTTK